MSLSDNYHRIALLLFLSATLHLAVILSSGGNFLMEMVIGFILFAIIGYGLLGRRRWLAYLAFLATLAGAIYAMGFGMSTFGLVQMSFLGIALIDLIAALLLFGLIWRRARA